MVKNRYFSGVESDHFNGRFFNLFPRTEQSSIKDIIRWKRTSQPAKWPDSVSVTQAVPDKTSQEPCITLSGHASVLIQIQELNILTDPIWSERAGPFSWAGPRRVCRPGIAFGNIPKIDVILLSHNHYDHLDITTLRKLVERDNPRVITPYGNDRVIHKSIPSTHTITGDWWDRIKLQEDVEVTITPAQHWSARGIFDRRMALWSGFFVRAGRWSIYFAGDTGYGDGRIFPLIRERLGAPDIALLPIGAYEPRWMMRDSHMDPAEALTACEALEARQALALHWGVFNLSDEGRDEPAELLRRVVAQRGVDAQRFIAPEPGYVCRLE